MAFSTLFVCTAGICGGIIFRRLNIPAGALLGSLSVVTLSNICFDAVYLPLWFKTFAQICAGAVIAQRIDMPTVRQLPRLLAPFSVLMSVYVVLNLVAGGLIFWLSDGINLATALLMAVPGGASDVVLITEDMGGDTPSVLAMQLLRLVIGVGFLPLIPAFLSNKRLSKQQVTSERSTLDSKNEGNPQESSTSQHLLNTAITALCAAFCGILGQCSGIPAGALVFSLVGVGLLKLFSKRSYMPPRLRVASMLLNGCYIGSTIFMSDILAMYTLILPATILVVGYTLNCIGMAWLLSKYFGFELRVALLISTPAGATDMALIAEDMGIRSAELCVIQVFRVITAIALFPQIIWLVLKFYG